ncbi:MAG: DUF5131 family protein [Candidatus Latescibacteria bacterium]|nr:DUF5131 family protein [Candidatus Latescibacterota bacterium]
MSRMFKSIDKTWNVFVGCKFDCSYCNVRKLVKTRLKHSPRYKDGFRPHLVESELKRTFKPGQFIFVAYMGDIAWAERLEVAQILTHISKFPKTDFLIQSKDPSTFAQWELYFPPNVVLGTTIETNRDYKLTKAPYPRARYQNFPPLYYQRLFLSIEPIMDFDLDILTRWVAVIKPEIIEVGADNYHNHLPEPSGEKLHALLNNLRNICPKVIEKDGLNRLKEGGDRNG